jgi:hypothetical protein
MIAVLAAALIISRVRIFTESAVYLTGAVIAALFILAVRFPRAGGFPLILLAGVATVWLGFSFLRYPAVDPLEDPRPNLEVSSLRAPDFCPLIGGQTRFLPNND